MKRRCPHLAGLLGRMVVSDLMVLGFHWGKRRSAGLAPLALVASLWVPAVSGAAPLYSWEDANGVLHVTNLESVARARPYRGPDAEGFGGERPIVQELPSGKKRTLYRVDVSRFDGILREAAEHYNLPMPFLKAVAKVESNFNPKAVSNKQARGIMQLIDSTAELVNVTDPYDPKQSIFGGARYLRLLANMFDGDLALTAAAYNAGPERVKRSKGIPKIRETTRYVKRVLQMYHHYQENG